MTSRGLVPLRSYADGGVAYSAQMAMFGEGSTPEAFIPLKNGAVPVKLQRQVTSPGNDEQRPVTIQINAPLVYFQHEPTVNEVRQTAFQAGQALRRVVGRHS